MKVRGKLILLVCLFLIVHVTTVMSYYVTVLAIRPIDQLEQDGQALSADVTELAEKIEAQGEYEALLRAASGQSREYRVENLQGGLVFTASAAREAGRAVLQLTEAQAFSLNGQSYLLRGTEYITAGRISQNNPAKRAVQAQLILSAVLLSLFSFLFYRLYLRPIERMQREIEEFKRGKLPGHTQRRDELGKLQNALSVLAEDLKKEEQAQTRIVASLSHDIKTPLTSLLGYTEQLQRPDLSRERQIKYARIVHEKSLAIEELVREFDDYMGVKLDKQPDLQNISVKEFLCAVRRDFAGELELEGVRFSLLGEETEGAVAVDMAKMRRVFGNLIGNSVKHSGAQRPLEICVSVCAKDGGFTFRVADNGRGVPTGERDRVFEMFYTSDPGRQVAGLGLPICRSIVESHGGEMWGEETPGGGFTAVFSLPCAR